MLVTLLLFLNVYSKSDLTNLTPRWTILLFPLFGARPEPVKVLPTADVTSSFVNLRF